MTRTSRPRSEVLDEIRGLRQRLAELEEKAGDVLSPTNGFDRETVRHGMAVVRGLMETLLLGFAVGDFKGRIVDANEAFANLLGYGREDLLAAGLNWQQITPPEYAEADRASLEAMERTGLSHPYAKEYFHRNGSRIQAVIVIVYTTSERDEHAVFVLDDSARSSAEADLRRTELTYHAILDAIPDLVLLRGPDARIAGANRAYLDFFGTTQRALLGSIAPPGYDGSALEGELRDHAVVLETGMTVDLPQHTLGRADGATRVFHTVKSPVLGPDGTIVRTVSVSRDVTDRTRAEQALQRSEASLRTAQAIANAGSYHMPYPPTSEGYWSEQIFTILGLPVSSVTMAAESFIDIFVLPDHATAVTKAVEAALLEGRSFDITYPIRRLDGSRRWVRSIGAPSRDSQGNVDGIVGTLWDVTEQREAEAAREALDAHLRQAQKLEVVGTLARGVANDFSGILGALASHAALAFEAARDDPHLREDLQQVLDAVGRASGLAARLLAFSRQGERSNARLRLDRPIREALQLLRATLPADVEIHEALHPEAPEIRGDETQMLQVVVNLGTNAVHAMASGGGRLTVGLEPFEADAAFVRLHPELEPGPYALLTVSDTGSGIAPHLLERVFEPFFTTKPPGEGTGLGLSVVHGIVREHGGALAIESAPGEGTRVRVHLPAYAAESEGSAPGAISIGSGQRVLRVGADHAAVEREHRQLKNLGYAPVTFTDARRALEEFRRRPRDFDLVVTDQALPHLAGTELAREVHRIRPKLPVVLLSSHAGRLRPAGFEAAGIRAFLGRPVSMEALAAAVAGALEKTPD